MGKVLSPIFLLSRVLPTLLLLLICGKIVFKDGLPRIGDDQFIRWTNISQDTARINLTDIIICIRTTSQSESRMVVLLKTWLPLATNSVFVISDYQDRISYLSNVSKDHWIFTNCHGSHKRSGLCCKMEAELTLFLNSGKRWFCHVDDDSYINIPSLIKLLSLYNNKRDWYIGKRSIPRIQTRDNVSFEFATGGACFCLSRSLILKMSSYVLNPKFVNLCDKLFLPDDCTIGYIINYIFKVDLTVIPQLHSHLEDLREIKLEAHSQEISFSYNRHNTVSVSGFSLENDPTRFYSAHCHLQPYSKECFKLKRSFKWQQ